ncbi:LppU/SCO3897 family protein [Amycolatopsis kentuckyensis]|uniref:LppU/SCO3897 family protein n=1 Tax=Amycolatopsis kentuckyensis TaxID=218823 RepID=UPI0035625D9C
MTTPPSDDNPFRTPSYAAAPPPMPPVPGQRPIPHWFTPKVRTTLIVCVVLALALGSLSAWGLSRIGRYGTPSDGDCLYLSRESGDRLAYHNVGCSSDRATYKVETSRRTTGTCAAGDYVRFRLGSGETLCLALNVRTGDCLRGLDDETTVAKVSCSDPTVQERAQILSGYGREDECERADKVLSYAGSPSRTVCLAPPGENI